MSADRQVEVTVATRDAEGHYVTVTPLETLGCALDLLRRALDSPEITQHREIGITGKNGAAATVETSAALTGAIQVLVKTVGALTPPAQRLALRFAMTLMERLLPVKVTYTIFDGDDAAIGSVEQRISQSEAKLRFGLDG